VTVTIRVVKTVVTSPPFCGVPALPF
jgi:hypothetical protein